MSDIFEKMFEAGLDINETIKNKFSGERLNFFYQFLLETNEKYGLFSKSDTERILDRHLYESMIFVHHLTEAFPVSRETAVADVGTGPGLPGMLFACMQEPPDLTLIDSSKRKTELLEIALLETTLFEKIRFIYERVENIKKKYSIVVSRAVVPFPHMAEVAYPLWSEGGILAMAAGKIEITDRIRAYLGGLGVVSRETIQLPELAFLGERSIIVLSKISRSKKGYPRQWKKIKEEIEAWRKS